MPCRRSRSAPATPSARHATALEAYDGDVLILSGDTPMLTAGLLRELVETHRRDGADATILSAEPPDPRLYGRVVRDADGAVREVVEGTDASEDEQRIREINCSIYVFRSEALWPALERLEPKNVQGELYLTDAIESSSRPAAKVAAHIAADYRETDGVNTRVELAQAAAVLRDRINEQHMLAGVTIVDPQTTWIEPRSSSSPTRRSTRSRSSAARRASPPALRSAPNTVAIDTHVGAGATVGPFCYLRPGRSSASPPRRAPSWRSRTHGSATARKCRICRTSATPRSATTRTSAPGRSPPTSRTSPGAPKGRTTIGSNVRTGIHNGFVAPIEIGDGAWIAAGSVITKDVPADALAFARPRQENKEGYAARGRDTELVLPGLDRRVVTQAEAEPLDRARSAEAPDGLLRAVAHRPRAADRPAARRRARRGRGQHVPERRDLRAATTSRSAAPTSSSCRPAASRSTATSWSCSS